MNANIKTAHMPAAAHLRPHCRAFKITNDRNTMQHTAWAPKQGLGRVDTHCTALPRPCRRALVGETPTTHSTLTEL